MRVRRVPRRWMQGLTLGAVALGLSLAIPAWAQKADEKPAEETKAPQFEEDQEAALVPPPTKPELPPPPPSLNPETLRMMEMIERKNRELRQREENLALREKNLKTLEAKVREDLKKIEEALARSEELVGIKRDLIEKNVNNLVKVYSTMKPDQAATLLEALDEGVAIQILSRMKSKTAGAVLGRMKTEVAKRISEKIAGKRQEPEATARAAD